MQKVTIKSKFYKSLIRTKKLLVYCCGWDMKIWYHYPGFKIMNLFGYDVIAFEYSKNIIYPHPDPKDHTQRLREAVEKVVEIVKKHESKYDVVNFFGTSIGSSVAMITSSYVSPNKIEKIVLNLFAGEFATALWQWEPNMYKWATTDFKEHIQNRDKYIESGGTIEDAKTAWKYMYLPQYLDRLNSDTKFLLYSTKGDRLISFESSRILVKALQEKHFFFREHILGKWFGHLRAGFYNLLLVPRWLRFLID